MDEYISSEFVKLNSKKTADDIFWDIDNYQDDQDEFEQLSSKLNDVNVFKFERSRKQLTYSRLDLVLRSGML